MKSTYIKTLFFSFAVALLASCGGSNSNNQAVLPPGCVPGYPCNTLPPGAALKYSGTLYNINQGIANDMVKTLNGSLYSAGQVIDLGSIDITAQGLPTGGTNYYVNMVLQPRSKNPWWNFCLTVGTNCNQTIVISGNAAYYPDNAGGHILQLQYGGWKIQIFATTGSTDNAWNGTLTNINNITIKFVRPNKDPITEAENFANTALTLYNNVGYGGYPMPYAAGPAGGPGFYSGSWY